MDTRAREKIASHEETRRREGRPKYRLPCIFRPRVVFALSLIAIAKMRGYSQSITSTLLSSINQVMFSFHPPSHVLFLALGDNRDRIDGKALEK